MSIVNRIPEAFLVKMLDWKLRKKPLLRALREYNHWTGGAAGMSLEESLEATKRFVIQRHELARITCPALALVSAREGEVMVRQAEQFYEAISSPVKKMHVFSLEQDGSDDHCQMDNRARWESGDVRLVGKFLNGRFRGCLLNREFGMQQIYQIRVKGILNAEWSECFEGLIVEAQADGETLLTLPVVDQACLRGIVTRLWDRNVTVISVLGIEMEE